jgi:hypothetical protein
VADEIAFKISDLMPIVAGLSALLGVYISNRAHESRMKLEFENSALSKKNDLKRTKLEEMHTLFQKWEMDVSGLYLIFIPVYKGDYSAEKAMEISTKGRLQEKGDYQRFQTIIQLYFPTLEKEFELVYKERAKIMSFCALSDEFSLSRLKEFYSAQESFEKQALSFKKIMSQQLESL